MENLKLGANLTSARHAVYKLAKQHYGGDCDELFDWCDEFMDANQSITALCALKCVLDGFVDNAESRREVEELCEIHGYVSDRAKRILGPARWERLCNKPYVEPRVDPSEAEKLEKLFDKVMETQAA